MDCHGLGEVVGYNDPRTMVVGEAGKDIESGAILLELDVDVGEPLAADFFHQRRPGGTASTLGPALARRAICRDRVFTERFREMTNRLGPQVHDFIQPEFDEVSAFAEGDPSLTLGLRRVSDEDDRRDLRHVIAPQWFLESAFQNGGPPPPDGGGPHRPPGSRSHQPIRRPMLRNEPFPRSGRSWNSGGPLAPPRPRETGGVWIFRGPIPPHRRRPPRPPP